MKKIIFILMAIVFSIPAIAQSTINITTSGGSFPNEKWVSVTTLPDGAGTQVFGQGDGTQCNGSGYINQDIMLAPGTYYVNCYDQYDDGWDGTLISVTAYGAIIGNNGGVSPDDGTDTDLSFNCEGTPEEREASFMIVVPSPPSCLSPSALTVSNTTTTSATVSWTAGGSEMAWQYVRQAAGLPAPTGTGTATASSTVNLSGLTANTAYDFYVRAMCGGGPSTYAGPVSFYTGYCIPTGANSATTYIDNFSTTGGTATNITNTASGYGTGGYQDNFNTGSVTSFATGSFNFTTTIVSGTVGAAVWVDWNKNLVFDASERVYNTTSYTAAPSGSITVPAGLSAGDYRMRIKIDYFGSNPTNPCTVARGEVEDYKLTLTAAPTCAQPSGSTISAITTTSAVATWNAGIVTAVYNWKVVASGAGSAGTAVASGNTANLTTPITGLTPGTAYDFFVKADCFPDFVGPTAFSSSALPPANDQCSNALTITASTNASCTNKVTGTTEAATTSAANGCSTTGKDVWYIFTPAATGNYLTQVTEVTESGFNSTYVSVYSGACGTLTQIGTSCFTTSTTVALTAGTPYLLNVRSTGAAVTSFVTFDLCIRQIVPPANDECATAATLTVNPIGSCASTNTVDHAGATDSLATYSCDTTAPGTNIDTWYTFVAPASGSVTFEFTNGTQTGTPKMALFDACGGVESFCSTTNNIKIASGLTAGATYTMSAWYDSFNTKGTFTICASISAPPPANDDCANATSIAIGQTIEQNSTGSTATPEGIGCSLGDSGLWFTFAGTGDMVTVTSAGSFDLEIAVASGSCGTFTNVTCEDGEVSNPEVTTFATTLATTYYIYIAHWSSGNTTTGPLFVTLTGADNTWNGTAWTAGTPPTITENAVIDGPYNTGTDGNIDAGSMIINIGNTVTVAAGSYVRTAGDISVNGTLTVEHEGSVVQDFDTALTFNNGNNITVEKTTPVLAARDFMIIGSPMTAETVADVYGSFINVQENFPANFVPNPDVAALDPFATNFADDNGNDWLQVTTGALIPGRANLVIPQATAQGSGSAAISYNNGTLNSGTIAIPLQYNGSQNASPNMMANPYASAIDADAMYVENSALFDVVYFWEHLTAPDPNYPGYGTSNYDMGDISMYNPITGVGNTAPNGGTIPTQFIASGQGFAVKALSAGTFSFTNNMRLTGNNDTYRRDANMELFYVNVISESYSLASSTAIHFTENATNGFDLGYDNARLASPVSLYGKTETGEELAIQSRAAFSNDDVITLGFSTQVDVMEEYSISINNLRGELLTNATVFLLDNANGNLTNLSEGNYNFQSNAGAFPDRFTILFRDPSLGVNSNNALTVGLYPNPANSIVTIASPKALINNITIVDMSGRIIENVTVDSQNTFQLNVATLNSAIYFVKITTDNGQITKRLIKN